jgi:hypothetical protein
MAPIARRIGLASLVAASGLIACLAAQETSTSQGPSAARWRQHDIRRPKPPVVEPAEASIAAKPPKDAVVLFDGKGLDAWKSREGGPAQWNVTGDSLETVPGAGPIETKQTFGDVQLHVEWSAPSPPVGKGQDRGNSGVFLMGQFEIQVLDSYQAETYADGQAASIYGQYPPLFNASRPPGQWQTYDIAFRRPRFDGSGKLLEPARITVFHNGILVQNNEEPFGRTNWLRWHPYAYEGNSGPISLQDHDHPVRYRNIWVRELPERAQPTAKDLARPKVITLPTEALDQFVGQYGRNTKARAASMVVAREGNHLTIKFPFQRAPLVIEPISETEFDMPFTDGRFIFHKDDRGRITGVLFKISDSQREMRKIEP